MNKIKISTKNIYVITFFSLAIFISIFLFTLNKKASDILTDYANIQAKRIAIEILKDTGLKEVSKIIKDKELYRIIKNNNGQIESIDFNTTILNESLIAISSNVRKRFKEIEDGKNIPEDYYGNFLDSNLKRGIICNIPIGIVSSNNFFKNLGPKIPIKIEYLGNVSVDVKTDVKDYGINSALIESYIYIEVTQKAILPFSSKEIKVSSKVPIIMKVVKGTIPNYYSDNSKMYSLPSN